VILAVAVHDKFVVSIDIVVSVRGTDRVPFGIVKAGGFGAGDILLDEFPIGIEVESNPRRVRRREFLSEKMRGRAKEEGEEERKFNSERMGHREDFQKLCRIGKSDANVKVKICDFVLQEDP
jgi:hypothetical protein